MHSLADQNAALSVRVSKLQHDLHKSQSDLRHSLADRVSLAVEVDALKRERDDAHAARGSAVDARDRMEAEMMKARAELAQEQSHAGCFIVVLAAAAVVAVGIVWSVRSERIDSLKQQLQDERALR